MSKSTSTHTDRLVITIYPPGNRANSAGEAHHGTWDDIAEWLCEVQDVDTKHDASLWSPIDIRETGDRKGASQLSFFPLEFDGLTDAEWRRVRATAAQLDCVVYTTSNSKPGDVRCRIAARTTRSILRAEQWSCVQYFQAAAGVVAPAEAKHASQAWYRAIRGAKVLRYHGAPLDVDEAVQEHPPRKRKRKLGLSEDEIKSVDVDARIGLARERLSTYTGESSFFAACILTRDYAIPPVHALPLLRKWCRLQEWATQPDDDELLAKLENAEQYGSGELGAGLLPERAWTDAGNAERMIDLFGDDLRYVRNLGWYIWDGVAWREGTPTWYAVATARNTGRYAKKTENEDLAAFALKSESAKSINAAIAIAKDHEDVVIEARELDTDAWVLNVRNGMIDLHTGRLGPHDREKLITKVVEIEYDEHAVCPRFERFLREVFDGDDEVVQFMQRFLGYCLTGDVSEHVIALWYGHGRNGKSTLIEVIQHVLGPYAGALAPGMLLADAGTHHSTERVDLRGLRFAFESEIDEGRQWNEALLKRLTGGDTIKGRRLYREAIEFRPTHKIVMSANSKPITRNNGLAFWKRMVLVPFEVSFAGREDRGLYEQLCKEAPGILTWCVKGCLAWQKRGLDIPQTIRKAVNAYRNDMDLIVQFVDQCLEIADDPDVRVDRVLVHKAFADWCVDEGVKFTRNAFYRMMAEHGYTTHRSMGRDVYTGLRVKRPTV